MTDGSCQEVTAVSDDIRHITGSVVAELTNYIYLLEACLKVFC